jgi:hypothetical protein
MQMTQHPPTGDRLTLTPALDPGDVTFLAGFSMLAGRVARIWPGQPAVPSPWAPCDSGCCLVLVPTRAVSEAAGQWLRFLIAEFLGGSHRVNGRVSVPGSLGRASMLLIVEAGDVFEGELGDARDRGAQ